jgi:hypothetical protein
LIVESIINPDSILIPSKNEYVDTIVETEYVDIELKDLPKVS